MIKLFLTSWVLMLCSCQYELTHRIHNRTGVPVKIYLNIEDPHYPRAKPEQIVGNGETLEVLYRYTKGMKIEYGDITWIYPAIPFPWEFRKSEKWMGVYPGYFVDLNLMSDGSIRIAEFEGSYSDPIYPSPSFPIRPVTEAPP